MADWESLRSHVATRYHVGVDERERFRNPAFDALSVWVATSRGRRLVTVTRRKDYSDDWYVEVAAPLTTAGSPDPVSLLEWGGRNVGTLVLGDGELFYKRAYPLDWLDLPRIKTALDDAAGTSAGLEASIAEHGGI